MPPRPYSTDIRATLELVIWALDHDEYPYFSILRSEEEAFPNTPFGVGFAPKMWRYGETAEIGICLEAFYHLKQVEVNLTIDES